MGYSDAMLERPIVGIATAGGGFNNCHRTTPDLVAAVSRGVLAAGGLPLEFPTISLGEPYLLHQPRVPQPDGDGRRGDDPRAADGFGRADRRVRQDDAGAAHGRDLREQAGDCARRRRDDDRQLRRNASGCVHGLPRVVGALSCGRARRRAHPPARSEPRHHRGHVRRHGHGEHDGLRDRSARHEPAGCGDAARRPRRTAARRGGDRRARGRARARGPHARQRRDAAQRRERAARAARDRRFDQRRDPPHRDRRAARHSADAAAFQRVSAPHRCW